MNDRELLELAAKAAGIRYDVEKSANVEGRKWWGLWLSFVDEPGEFARRHWNPLADDGDALRLAVKLGVSIAQEVAHGCVYCDVVDTTPTIGADEEYAEDPYAATRRAIVRAAADIGKATP